MSCRRHWRLARYKFSSEKLETEKLGTTSELTVIKFPFYDYTAHSTSPTSLYLTYSRFKKLYCPYVSLSDGQ